MALIRKTSRGNIQPSFLKCLQKSIRAAAQCCGASPRRFFSCIGMLSIICDILILTLYYLTELPAKASIGSLIHFLGRTSCHTDRQRQ